MGIVREHINEKFVEDSDPISDMGIGLRYQIKKWLHAHEIYDYEINDDLTIDVNRSVDIHDKNIKKFPEFIQFRTINGDFLCYSNNLVSLRGCPQKVRENFICSNNLITSLKYGPTAVGGNYYCHMNPYLKSLKGCSKRVGGSFSCDTSNIRSLEYCPVEVGGSFMTYNNPVKFTKTEINERCLVKEGIINEDR